MEYTQAVENYPWDRIGGNDGMLVAHKDWR